MLGVMRRFAVYSMVLGVLAMAGGASAFAFNGSSGVPAVQPADEPADASAVSSDVPADVPTEVLPETGGPDAAWRWATPHGG
jgi:hypothetical protein